MSTIDEIAILQNAVSRLRLIVQTLGEAFPKPEYVRLGSGSTKSAFRHPKHDRTAALASYCKAVNLCSLLGAIGALLRAGFLHEAYALCRIIDEQGEDILFLTLKSTQTSNYRTRFLADFYREEFADVDDPFSIAERGRVPRQKIRAAIYTKNSGLRDPSTAVAAARSFTHAFSGFVHGPYVHIMDLYGGDPPMFNTGGLSGTPRMVEALRSVPFNFLRAAVAIASVCRATGNLELAGATDVVIGELEHGFPFLKKA
jgi:hypothetical protein